MSETPPTRRAGSAGPAVRLPTGVRDFLPRAARRRRAIADDLRATYESWGYQGIITPLFEYADVLERGLGGDAKDAAIRFIEPATGEVVALRPDITPQVARIAATRMTEIGGSIRLCYEGSVARSVPGSHGQREVLQSGVELLDAAGPFGDAEVLALACSALSQSAMDKTLERSLDLGHVVLPTLASIGIDDTEQAESIAACLRKKDRIGVARAAHGLPTAQRALLESLPMLFGDPASVLASARELDLPNEAKRALAQLEESIELASALAPNNALLAKVTLDLGEVRGFEYYTGMRIGGYVKGAGAAVLQGGRYDQLVECYGRRAHATGFAIDVEALAQAESAAARAEDSHPSLPGILLAFPSAQRALASALAPALRQLGVRVGMNPIAVEAGDRNRDLLSYGERVDLPIVLLLSSSSTSVLLRTGNEPELVPEELLMALIDTKSEPIDAGQPLLSMLQIPIQS